MGNLEFDRAKKQAWHKMQKRLILMKNEKRKLQSETKTVSALSDCIIAQMAVLVQAKSNGRRDALPAEEGE
jgi:hypothetical protein